jgi:DNA-binding protein
MTETTETTEKPRDDRGIFIGEKPFMNYVTACVMAFTSQNRQQLTIKARGKFISRAVDVAEVVRSRFLKDQADIKEIKIGSEEFTNKEGRLVRVSTIEITLSKK